jgi:integrase
MKNQENTLRLNFKYGMKPGRKGTVGIENNGGVLRLRLPRQVYGGRQKYLYLGLNDTKENRKIAKAKAQAIESDIFFDRFDPTLIKYKPRVYSYPEIAKPDELNLGELWQQYADFKAKHLSPSSMKDFRRVSNHIAQLADPSLKSAKAIARHFQEFLSADAAKRTLTQVNACCKWAVEQELIKENPFDGMARRVKVRHQQSINPFTAAERDWIIKAFEQSESHQHYAGLVKFLFLTGCRTSEAVGLTWQHVAPDLSSITFAEVVVEGERILSTKTHKIRKFPVNGSLKDLMAGLRPGHPQPSAPVFTDTQGNLVRPNNFLRRHWQPVVKNLPIAYRPQYNTRHTFITLCLEAKVPIAQVAAWVGNSPKIILEHYAGLTRADVPEL